MNDGDKAVSGLQMEYVSQLRLDTLLKELTKRTMVVNEDALTHLQNQGVIPRMARDGCCKPDGGTCCPNARIRLERGQIPKINPGL
ncbi:MAG: hypothetical protein ABW044_12050 [Cellvibrio sp.]